jgi:phosphatidylglycerophosphatase A
MTQQQKTELAKIRKFYKKISTEVFKKLIKFENKTFKHYEALPVEITFHLGDNVDNCEVVFLGKKNKRNETFILEK